MRYKINFGTGCTTKWSLMIFQCKYLVIYCGFIVPINQIESWNQVVGEKWNQGSSKSWTKYLWHLESSDAVNLLWNTNCFCLCFLHEELYTASEYLWSEHQWNSANKTGGLGTQNLSFKIYKIKTFRRCLIEQPRDLKNIISAKSCHP